MSASARLSILHFRMYSKAVNFFSEFWIFVKFKIKIHIRMQNAAFKFYVSVRQLGTQNVRCNRGDFFLAWLAESTRCGAAHSNYCGKRKHQCGKDVVYLKTETKPFTQNAYLLHFLEGHLSSLHSCLTQESPKPCKIHVSSTFKKHVITRLRN